MAAIAIAALVAGTIAAMAVTQRLRQEGPVARAIVFKDRPPGWTTICFRLTRDDFVETALVDLSGNTIRTLGAERLEGDQDPKEPESKHCYRWDETTETGRPVTRGKYRLRLILRDADRVATSGERLNMNLRTGP